MTNALYRETEKKPEILTLQEIQTLVKNTHEFQHEWKEIWAAALMTGMRSGELHALESRQPLNSEQFTLRF
ncbi:MAG: hypothetical protein JST80_05240 [Bdellovibrionales bacterium]|nr:hypothetical protein [Bdellovibrionales bacterium]